LASQLSGTAKVGVLSPVGALVALGAGALALARRTPKGFVIIDLFELLVGSGRIASVGDTPSPDTCGGT
jgi:hypothetical protein